MTVLSTVDANKLQEYGKEIEYQINTLISAIQNLVCDPYRNVSVPVILACDSIEEFIKDYASCNIHGHDMMLRVDGLYDVKVNMRAIRRKMMDLVAYRPTTPTMILIGAPITDNKNRSFFVIFRDLIGNSNYNWKDKIAFGAEIYSMIETIVKELGDAILKVNSDYESKSVVDDFYARHRLLTINTEYPNRWCSRMPVSTIASLIDDLASTKKFLESVEYIVTTTSAVFVNASCIVPKDLLTCVDNLMSKEIGIDIVGGTSSLSASVVSRYMGAPKTDVSLLDYLYDCSEFFSRWSRGIDFNNIFIFDVSDECFVDNVIDFATLVKELNRNNRHIYAAASCLNGRNCFGYNNIKLLIQSIIRGE